MDPTSLVLIALMIAAFYFLILRPQKKRQQAIQRTLNSLTPGARVLLGSGLFGTIVSLGDRQAVLEISPGVHLTVLKQAIIRTATEADEDAPELEDGYDDLDRTAPLTGPSTTSPLPTDPTNASGPNWSGTDRSATGSGSTGAHSLEPGHDRPFPSPGSDPNRLG